MGTGFFGKLPASGDFVARGLPSGARAMLDRWLTRLLLACGAETPERWPEGGVRGVITHAGQPLALLVVPSLDAAGREFPLAAAVPAQAAGQAQIEDWAGQALPLLERAAQGELDAEALIALLGEVPPPSSEGRGLSSPQLWARGSPPEDPDGFVARMAGPDCPVPMSGDPG